MESNFEAETLRLKAIIAGTRAGTWEWNVQTNEVIVNERWAEIIGYKLDELENHDSIALWRALCHPEDLKVSDKCFEDCFTDKSSHYECIVRLRHKDGHWIWVHDRGMIVTRTVDNLPEWTAGTHIDITSEHKAQSFLKKLAKSVPGVIYTFQIKNDGKYHFPYVSDKCRLFYDASPEAIQSDASIIFDAIYEDDRLPLIQSIESSYNDQTDWTFEYRIHASDEKVRWLYANASFEFDGDGIPTWHGMIIDITDKKELESKLIELSTVDELTGIYNRREMINRLNELMLNARRYNHHHCLALIDLDNFKNINDIFGHHIGDAVLRGFASVCKGRLRQTDVFGRFGGEEFVIIMPETSLYDSQQICETLLEDFRQFRINPALEIPAALNLSFSAGLTVIKYSDTDTSDIINRADHAMYQAKSAGKGQVFLNEVA